MLFGLVRYFSVGCVVFNGMLSICVNFIGYWLWVIGLGVVVCGCGLVGSFVWWFVFGGVDFVFGFWVLGFGIELQLC